jgi:cyclase
MLKKRIIFTLLYQNKSFYLSRNFRLQKIGNLDWLKKNYDFSILTKSVDEIIILNVSREKNQIENFSKVIKKFSKECFLPISVGGKIIDIEVAKKYISSGADKLVVNTNLFNKTLIKEIASTFGAQCVIGSIDYIKKKNNFDIYIKNGKEKFIKKIKLVFEYLEKMPVGEILLNSIDQDGTGNGFDFDILKHVPKNFAKPVILSGGAGNYKHILKALKNKKVDSIATANLLNFVGNGLQEARYLLMRNGIKLAEWI